MDHFHPQAAMDQGYLQCPAHMQLLPLLLEVCKGIHCHIEPCYDSVIHFVKYNALIVSQFQAIRHIENSSHAKIKVFDMLQAKVSCYTVDITIW